MSTDLHRVGPDTGHFGQPISLRAGAVVAVEAINLYSCSKPQTRVWLLGGSVIEVYESAATVKRTFGL